MIRTTTSLITLATLVACVAPNEPTVSARDVDRAFAEAVAISALPQTTIGNLPTGNVTYTGKLGADVYGDANGSILGDLAMTVGFASNDIGGRVTNINLIDSDGTPNQRFDGRLDIDGVETNGQLDAFAFGEITGVDVDDVEVSSDVLLALDGHVYDDFGGGDAIFGSASGDAIGDFDLGIEGVFYGTAD